MHFVLLVFTVSNVQAPFVQLDALINGINDGKSKIMVLIRHLETRTLKGREGLGYIYL